MGKLLTLRSANARFSWQSLTLRSEFRVLSMFNMYPRHKGGGQPYHIYTGFWRMLPGSLFSLLVGSFLAVTTYSSLQRGVPLIRLDSILPSTFGTPSRTLLFARACSSLSSSERWRVCTTCP